MQRLTLSVMHAGCCCLCCDTDELPEQGVRPIQHSYCQSDLLCYVYYLHHHSIYHTIPGELWLDFAAAVFG